MGSMLIRMVGLYNNKTVPQLKSTIEVKRKDVCPKRSNRFACLIGPPGPYGTQAWATMTMTRTWSLPVTGTC